MLAHIQQGPVVLTQNDHAAAVLVLPEQWNALLEEVEDLRDALDAAQAYAAYQQAPEAPCGRGARYAPNWLRRGS